jgi:predicted TIM-barrel fold metal-dependent hydrolase
MGNLMPSSEKRRIVDAHFHFYAHEQNQHDFLEHVDAMFQALVGDYSALPRKYLLDDYLAEAVGVDIVGLVWNEFLSSDPVREVLWAQRMADNLSVPMSIVGLVDFLGPDLEARLETYAQCPNVTGVREHLGWDHDNPLRRFAKRPDLLTDSQWRRGLGILRKYDFKCSLEVFSPQLSDLLAVVRPNPDIGFTLAVMGWPLAIDESGFTSWKHDLAALSACENVRLVISAIECIFGMTWSLPQVLPWIETIFELFGPERTMFGSHRPISGLAVSFETLYSTYETMTAGLSSSEQDAVFCLNAAEWFQIPAIADSATPKRVL